MPGHSALNSLETVSDVPFELVKLDTLGRQVHSADKVFLNCSQSRYAHGQGAGPPLPTSMQGSNVISAFPSCPCTFTPACSIPCLCLFNFL